MTRSWTSRRGSGADRRHDAWNLDSAVAMRHGSLAPAPGDARDDALRRRAPPRRPLPPPARRPTSCCSTSPPTTSMPSRVAWLERFLKDTRAPSSPSPTTATSSTTSPAGFSSSIAGGDIPFEGELHVLAGAEAGAARARGEAGSRRVSGRSPRELEWVRMSPRARQAKTKARSRLYEELLAERARDKPTGTRSTSRRARGSATWWSRLTTSARVTAIGS